MSITKAGGTMMQVFNYLPNRTDKELNDLWDYYDEHTTPLDLESITKLAETFENTEKAFHLFCDTIPGSIGKASPESVEVIVLLIEREVRRIKVLKEIV